MDLTTDEGIQSYLTTTPGLYPTCHKIDRLPEGFGGFVYRAHLGESSSPSSVIVKHVQPYAARAQSWKLDQTRLEFEYKALQVLARAEFQGGGGVVRPPGCLHFDRDNWVIILEDAGDLLTLKSWLQPDKITIEDAQTVGVNLGQYLAIVHEASTRQPDLLSDFTGNETAKTLSSQLYFGMLPSAAAQHGFEGEHIQKAADQGKANVLEGFECLTLGDFWTGNVLVSNAKELFVLDFELTKPGTPDFDVGQMAAEMYCLACFRDAELGNALLKAFLKWYEEGRKQGVSMELVAKVAIRIGAHLMVMMPTAWSVRSEEASEEQVKEQLKVADRLLKMGVERDEKALRRSIIAPLLRN